MASPPKFPSNTNVFVHIFRDIIYRTSKIWGVIISIVFEVFASFPRVVAIPQYSNGQKDSLYNLTAPDNDTAAVIASENSLNIKQWDARGRTIRLGGTTATCLGNLSMAIEQLTTLAAAEYNGASGTLSLLPTAGALAGAPTKELWAVTKLMPIAGILAMLLSLGGSLVPSQASEYNPSDTYSYEGMMSTSVVVNKFINETPREVQLNERNKNPSDVSDKFAALEKEVRHRQQNPPAGGGHHGNIWLGVFTQLGLLAALLVTLWYAQLGAVILWWCQATEWMYYWYIIVAFSSLLENYAGIPFTEQTTLRLSNVAGDILLASNLQNVTVPEESRSMSTLERLRKDPMNTKSYLKLPKAYAWNVNCFYVIISIRSIRSWHATLRVFSKFVSVGVFAVGTAAFASAQFLSITVALMTLSMVLVATVFGRVVALWIAKSLMASEPIIHKIVDNEIQASQGIDRILSIPNLQVEVLGHVIINGKSVHRRNEWLSSAKWLGICAGPFDLKRLERPIVAEGGNRTPE